MKGSYHSINVKIASGWELKGNFYIYYPRKRLDDHEYDYMYRRLVTIN